MEALGRIEIHAGAQGSLVKSPRYDIVILPAGERQFTRKIYLNTCDHRPRRIEYLSERGEMLTVEMGDYRELSEDCFIPSRLHITVHDDSQRDSSFETVLNNIKPKQFSPKKKEILFSPPDKAGYENIYLLTD
mgnify:CR=1 FL=1